MALNAAGLRAIHRESPRRGFPTMYERKGDKLLPWPRFVRRMALSFGLTLAVVSVSLAAGVLGYHLVTGLSWIDSLLNASMILAGMGPWTR